jgi:hypothetical protein
VKREEYEEIMSGLKMDEWLETTQDIYLKSGMSFHSDPEHKRYLYQNKKILVQHGTSELYGDRLKGLRMVSGDYTTLTFDKEQFKFNFRPPKVGDTLILVENGKIIASSPIMEINGDINGYRITLAIPVPMRKNVIVSFYDTNIYRENKSYCMHNTLGPGVFKYYKPNPSKKQYKNEPYHQIIKIKQIERIEV